MGFYDDEYMFFMRFYGDLLEILERRIGIQSIQVDANHQEI